MRAARAWFTGSFNATTFDEFNELCPPGSEANAYFRMVVSYWEMVASFITSGVLNQDLFFQSGGELLLVWEKVRPVVPAMRDFARNPAAYKNLETVGNSAIEHWKKMGPEAYEAFAARIKSFAPKK